MGSGPETAWAPVIQPVSTRGSASRPEQPVFQQLSPPSSMASSALCASPWLAVAVLSLVSGLAAADNDRSDAVFWWHLSHSDCPYDDVHLNGSAKAASCCKTNAPEGCTVDTCKALCLSIPACGGFNYPHGVLKKSNCSDAAVHNGEVDLYLAKSSPQPPPPTNFPPIWPHPAKYSNGTESVVLAGGDQFSFSQVGVSGRSNRVRGRAGQSRNPLLLVG